MQVSDEMVTAFIDKYREFYPKRWPHRADAKELLAAALTAKSRQGGAVNRMLLEQILQNAFFAGRGTSGIVSPEDMTAWQDYDYTKFEAYKRLRSVLEAAALSVAEPVKTAPAVAGKARKPKLPPIGNELRELYPSMSAQTHEDAVKEYARAAVSSALSAQVQDDEEQHETCNRCQGNGEIVTDWERYRHPHKDDVGDEAVAECPDCNGTGEVSAQVQDVAVPAGYLKPDFPDAIEPRYIPSGERVHEWQKQVFTTPVYTAPAVAVPDGWKLVPVEPTEEMVLAGLNCSEWADGRDSAVEMLSGTYRAVIAASPTPPQEGEV